MMALIEEKCKDLASKGSVELYIDADFDVDGVKIVKYEGLSSEYSAFKEHFENKGLSIQLENYGLVAILSWENENGDR